LDPNVQSILQEEVVGKQVAADWDQGKRFELEKASDLPMLVVARLLAAVVDHWQTLDDFDTDLCRPSTQLQQEWWAHDHLPVTEWAVVQFPLLQVGASR